MVGSAWLGLSCSYYQPTTLLIVFPFPLTLVISFIAYIMEVDAEQLIKTLTVRVVETQRGGRRGSMYESPLNPVQVRPFSSS